MSFCRLFSFRVLLKINKYMFESSKDVLYFTIAVCIAAFTFFSCLGLYYFAGFLRNVFKISKDLKKILKKVENIIDILKEKIQFSASYLFLIGEAVKKILEIMSDKGIKFPFRKKGKEKSKNGENSEENGKKIKKNKINDK